MGNIVYAQNSIFDKNIDWDSYEIKSEIAYKKIEVNKIKDDLLIYLRDKGG